MKIENKINLVLEKIQKSLNKYNLEFIFNVNKEEIEIISQLDDKVVISNVDFNKNFEYIKISEFEKEQLNKVKEIIFNEKYTCFSEDKEIDKEILEQMKKRVCESIELL